jgi:RNA polymerase sigma factor (sigma-70 family)
LVEQHIEWARAIAVKVASRLPTWWHADDLVGPASIALLDAATKFDKSRGIPFRAYAIRQVEGACYSAARRNEYRERAHNELTEDIADSQTARPPAGNANLPAQVWQLPPDQFRVVQLVYSHELTVEKAAERMGISPSKASQHHRAALQTLRGLMGKAA